MAVVAAVALVASISIAIVERQAALVGAASRALEAGIFALVLPLGLLALSTRVVTSRLDLASMPLARFGASRRAVAAGLILATALLGAALGALLSAAGAAIAHDPAAPPLLAHLPTSA